MRACGLVETGTRNRLVHTPRGETNTVTFRHRRGHGRPLRHPGAIRSCLAVSAGQPRRELALEIKADYESSIPVADATSNGLQTNLDEQRLEKRLLSIYRDAKTAEEEQGINILFLVIGFLRWYEDDHSEVLREAPLSCFRFPDPRPTALDIRLCSRDEDITANQAIQERLAPTSLSRCRTFQKGMTGVPRTISLT